jgi:hypothetical protein
MLISSLHNPNYVQNKDVHSRWHLNIIMYFFKNHAIQHGILPLRTHPFSFQALNVFEENLLILLIFPSVPFNGDHKRQIYYVYYIALNIG